MNQTAPHSHFYMVFLILGIILFGMQIYLAVQQMREKRLFEKLINN